MSSDQHLDQELQSHDIRPTYQRLKVLGCLHELQGHPTAEEIHARLLSEIPPLSLATVYNTLHTFVEKGLARVISIDGIDQRYDILLQDHGHFKCDRCGVISDFSIDIDSIPMESLAQYQIRARNVYFNGLCPNCLNQLKSQKEEIINGQ